MEQNNGALSDLRKQVGGGKNTCRRKEVEGDKRPQGMRSKERKQKRNVCKSQKSALYQNQYFLSPRKGNSPQNQLQWPEKEGMMHNKERKMTVKHFAKIVL